MKKKLVGIQKNARILQESCKNLASFWIRENLFVFLVAKTNWKQNIMTDTRLLDRQNWN